MNSLMQKDISLCLIVVILPSFTVLTSLIGTSALTITGLLMQQFLVALGSAAIGGLSGSLAPSHVKQ